jgi:hypothetical protein
MNPGRSPSAGDLKALYDMIDTAVLPYEAMVDVEEDAFFLLP